ncbi:MAG: carboxymuconolactone decarboxylase family protein [Acholeplasmataceae bacterium]|nr:carboxymuconolactone decarboxylase family protein [Acholeplasmataceae bacterium]
MANKYEKRKFNVFEHFPIMGRAALSMTMKRFMKRHQATNKKLKERIMLSVAEVNGCVLCSYVHTKIALQTGISMEEIKEILQGEMDQVPIDEVLAVLFAKDYAFNKEHVDQEFYQKLEHTYGVYKARAILNVCTVITMTTSMGISMGLFKETLMLRHIKGSHILNEILIPLVTLVFFPLFFIFSLFIVPFSILKLKKRFRHHQKPSSTSK